jgi:hypothetical protein
MDKQELSCLTDKDETCLQAYRIGAGCAVPPEHTPTPEE